MSPTIPQSQPIESHGWRTVFRPVLIMLFFLGALIVWPAILLSRLGIRLAIRERTLLALGGTLVTEMILFGLLLRWLKKQGKNLKDIGWGRPTTLSAILLSTVFALVYAAYTLSNPLIGSHASEISLFKIAGVIVGIIGAVVEECVFRGYILFELEQMNLPTLVQILISGISFGIIHIGFDLIGVVLTLIMGMVMATAFVIGKRSLTPSILGHVLINILIEPWLLLFIVTMYGRLGQIMG
ncbi:MAG: CPBP family glutamic-type intramembrane protease [Thermanaerothrix sp.]|nr:CPBP family glutamic-type intramembrane protease [Thermanaerothrix sp.]